MARNDDKPLKAEIKRKKAALSLLRETWKGVAAGRLAPGSERVGDLLPDCLLAASTRVVKNLSDFTPDPRSRSMARDVYPSQARLLALPEPDQALRYLCQALPRPSDKGSPARRLHKVRAWTLNGYVDQRSLLTVLDQAKRLAEDDLYVARERRDCGTERPRLRPWQPADHVFDPLPGLPDPERPPAEDSGDEAFLASLPRFIGSCQTLALAARLHGLRLYTPEPRFAGLPAYERMPVIIETATLISTPEGSCKAYGPEAYDRLRKLDRGSGIAGADAIHVRIRTEDASTGERLLEVPYTCVQKWEKGLQTLPVISRKWEEERGFDEADYLDFMTACTLIYPLAGPEEDLENARELARQRVVLPEE